MKKVTGETVWKFWKPIIGATLIAVPLAICGSLVSGAKPERTSSTAWDITGAKSVQPALPPPGSANDPRYQAEVVKNPDGSVTLRPAPAFRNADGSPKMFKAGTMIEIAQSRPRSNTVAQAEEPIPIIPRRAEKPTEKAAPLGRRTLTLRECHSAGISVSNLTAVYGELQVSGEIGPDYSPAEIAITLVIELDKRNSTAFTGLIDWDNALLLVEKLLPLVQRK